MRRRLITPVMATLLGFRLSRHKSMKIIIRTSIVVSTLYFILFLNMPIFALTCPYSFNFKCIKVDPKECPGLKSPTRCTVAGFGQIWDFVAPSRQISKTRLMGKSSCSILLPGDYSTIYGFSYYGKIADGEGSSFEASYCFYEVNGNISFAGLFSKQYINDPQHGDWEKTGYGVSCQDAKHCEFIHL